MDYYEMMTTIDELKDNTDELARVARLLEHDGSWTAPDTGETVVFRVEGARTLGLGTLTKEQATLAAKVIRATLDYLGLEEGG